MVTGRRVTGLRIEDGRVSELVDRRRVLFAVEAVVLAVPPWVAADLLPGQTCPTEFQAILNIHFRIEADPGPAGFIGLVGGTAEWVFVKRGHVSVTISAANRMVDQDAEAIARAVWPDVRRRAGPGWADAGLARGEGAPRHLRRDRGTGEAAAWRRERVWAIWCWPATGPRPGCPARSKVPSGPAEPRPRCFSPPEDARCRARHCCRTRPRRTTPLGAAIARAGAALTRQQHADGHWLFELEADATIPAEYVLLEHFLDRIDPALEAKIGVYLRVDPGRARWLAAVP